MGMQTLVELGLHGVIINFSSHEWARLQLEPDGSIAGDESALKRLAGLKQFVTRWYAMVALVFFLGCGLGGAAFLNHRPSGVGWGPPWICLVALNALLLWAWAFSAMLEGCNQMTQVNRVRLFQFVCGSALVWCSMAMGLGLWSLVISVAVRLAWDYWLICIRYRQFWNSLHVNPGAGAISWKSEIWPLQWRMAVLGVAGYLAFSLFVPVMFYCHGSVVAGQMGMTWTVLTAIESAAYSWVQVRAPLFGMLVARRDWRELDRVFRRLTVISWSFYAVCAVALTTSIWILNAIPYRQTQLLATRLLGLEPTLVFALAFLLLHLPRCQTIYVRSHKQDPFLISGIVSHGLIGFLVVVLGSTYGPVGAAYGLLAVVVAVNLPWWSLIFQHSRRAWHDPAVEG